MFANSDFPFFDQCAAGRELREGIPMCAAQTLTPALSQGERETMVACEEDRSMVRELTLQVNGEMRRATTDEDRPLLDVLREDFALTGTKFGCGQGECGACTVLVEGQPTRSCITTVGEIGERSIETIEGLAPAGELHPVQQAYLDHQALQCGYCVPGHIMTTVALVRDDPGASREKIVAALGEHICRCCNYANILAAAEQAAGRNARREDGR